MPAASARPRPGIEVHKSSTLTPADITTVNGIPCTTVARTLVEIVRAVLDSYKEPTLTEKAIEEALLALCREASLPSPAVNAWITLDDGIAYKADFLWRAERLIAETDGRDVHTTRKAFEYDRLRDQRLTLAGFTVVRFTWRQIMSEPQRVAEALRTLLARLARP